MSEPSMRRTGFGLLPLLAALTIAGFNAPALAADTPATPPANSADAPATDAANWSIESNKSIHSLLLDIAHAGKRWVVVGDRGHILYSDDQGQNWTQAKVPSRVLLTAVYFVDDQHGWAVGHDAQILASSDGGQTWVKQFEDLKREAPLLSVWFKDPANGLAVGAYGAMLATTDGGQHWDDVSTRLDNPDQFHLNAITAVKDSGLFVVGEQGSMFRSSDWGQTWEKLQGPYQGSLFGALAGTEPGVVLAYGLRGNLFRSADFGSTWEAIKLQAERGSMDYGLASGTRLDDGSLVIVGNGGSVLRSTDDGRSFKVFNRPDRIALAAVGGQANGNLILVGQGGAHSALPTGAEPVKQ